MEGEVDPEAGADGASQDGLPPEQREVTSDYEPSLAESTFGSISSSVNEHIWEYGRRYHVFRYGRYPIPNDEDEYKRESLRHAMMKEMLEGRLYLAPIGNQPQKIIDLGTGFGDWAIEVGEKFPSAKVIGVDLSPIQPLWLPPNVEFIVDDIEDEWVQDRDFDFAHLRFVGSVIKDNHTLFSRIFENLRPGGWVETQEIYPQPGSDETPLPADYAPAKFYSLCVEVLLKLYGFQVDSVGSLPANLERIGFVNVQRKVFHLPLGDWPRDPRLRMVGGYFHEVFMEWVTAVAARPFVEAGLDRTDIQELVKAVKVAADDKSIHAYLPIHFVWAQKPPE
ncbi:S-adenosyl-L-methionine-dependent methyltransferase [Lasiosphaeria ovina]|uniref:S-adenosyl-L-methionine-dependent methyltransferase n=1 Tax=Lasiosphaeria ovina TaxID=92902 RepID=A0AAE0K2L6_9PEZI|nr:S-adenosyl-L-methionine-dependent methyltransferase [Lasiosphaeria ovina]